MAYESSADLESDKSRVNIHFFKRLGNILKNKANHDMTPKTQQSILISKKVDELLNNEMYEFVLEIQASGYTLNAGQTKKLDTGFRQAIDLENSTSFETGLTLLAKSITLGCVQDHHLLDFFFSRHQLHAFVYRHRAQGTKYEKNWQALNEEQKTVYPLLFERLNEPAFVRQIYEKWVHAIEHTLNMRHDGHQADYFSRKVLSTFDCLQNYDEHLLFSQSTLDEYLQVISLLEKIQIRPDDLNPRNYDKYHKLVEQRILDMVLYPIKQNMRTYMAKQAEDFTQHTQEVFSVEYLENQTKQAGIRLAQHVDLSQLSIETLAILEDIKTKMTLIDVQNMDTQTKIHFDNLQQQRLPEILQKYFTIHEDYRDNLTDSKGKTPTRLMVEALVDIQDILQNLLLTQQEEKLKDLTVERTMTSEYKKRF